MVYTTVRVFLLLLIYDMINLHMNMFTPQIYIYTLMKQIKEKMNYIHSHTHIQVAFRHTVTHTHRAAETAYRGYGVESWGWE